MENTLNITDDNLDEAIDFILKYHEQVMLSFAGPERFGLTVPFDSKTKIKDFFRTDNPSFAIFLDAKTWTAIGEYMSNKVISILMKEKHKSNRTNNA